MLGCRAYYLQTQGLVLQKHFFPEQQVHSVTNPRVVWRHREEAVEVCQSPLLGEQSNREVPKFPQLTPSPHIAAALQASSGCRVQHWDFMDLEPHLPQHCLVVLVSWDQGDLNTEETPTFSGNTGLFPPPSRGLKIQSCAREQKTHDSVGSLYLINLLEKCHSFIDA